VTRRLLDTSFLTHALIPSQRTDDAANALAQLIRDGDRALVTDAHLVEFFSTLRKLVTRRSLGVADANAMRGQVSATISALIPVTEHDAHAAFVLATRLGQSDIFDTAGYVVAQRLGLEFWVSDRRFANAAAAAGLPGIRHIG
jgi:predicted nucleic acid-binding protein